MFQGVSFRKPGFANSLILRIGLLILFALAVFSFSIYQLIGRPSIDRLAEAQMQLVSEQLEARLNRLVKTVEITLRSSRDWGEHGALDHNQLLRFNELFFPILANNSDISSVIFAHESGREFLLLRNSDGHWINRISDPANWGDQTYWITWNAQRQIESVEMRQRDYDARTRPWFKGAMALSDPQSIFWTAPYIFYTTKEAGLTAATVWRAADGSRYVIGHDVRLSDIAEYTTQLTPGSREKAALFTSDGKLLAPPHDPRFTDRAAINKALLKTAEELEMPELGAGYAAWHNGGQQSGGLNGFELPDGDWFSHFRPIDSGTQRIWIGVFAPESDFNPTSQRDLWLLALITLVCLALGLIVAIRLAKQFGHPLLALAEESERIGKLELDDPVFSDAPWREVTQLATALETMREHLRNSRQALQDAYSELEITVANRTQALRESQGILQKRESFFRAVFDNAAVGIVSLDPQKQRTQVNRAYAEFTGYPIEVLLTKPDIRVLPLHEQDRLETALARLASGQDKFIRSEFEFLAKGGETRWGDVQITPIRSDGGELDSLLVTVLDITDRRQMEAELIRQFAFLQALLDTIPNPIFYKGPHTRFLGCNHAYEAFFGVDRADFIGKRVLDLDYLPEEARLAYQAEDEQVIAECGRISREIPMSTADGTLRDTLYSVTGFRTTEGEPGGLIGVIVDITPLKNAERESERARAAAEDAAAAKADFLANMSHEIRTPMNAIIGMTHLALQTDLTARQKNYLSKVDNAAKGLLGIINDILDLSKIEAGKMLIEQTAFRLDDNLQNLADVCLVKASERGLELLFDIASDVPGNLQGDPLRLNQVLLNLIGNAVKFTEQGEVTLTVSLASRNEDGVELHFEVRDTGIGMSEEQQQQLFKAFSQADSSTTRKYGGTGLGLSISKRIVEMMGGRIGVSSVPGIGSRFHFTLPFGLAAETGISRGRLGLPEQLNTLVIDDSPGARQIFHHQLLAFGLPSLAVASGPEGIAEIARANATGKPYQLLIIDWKMPGMDGIETLRRLRETQALDADVKIIMTTAFDHDELRQQLGQLSVDAILAKPVTPSSLFDAIVETVHRQGGTETLAGKHASSSGRPDLSGHHVLLVEDNEVNRELAEEMLCLTGLTVELAVNGEEAVKCVRQANYDLVLMDCQMPVMDGYEATRLIRAEPRFAELPIIAMTANAMASDRERCLATGMNDHIAKPIDVELLYATLARWLKKTGSSTQAPANPAMPSQEKSLSELAVLDENAALKRLGGNRAMFERILGRFHENQQDAIERLKTWRTAGDVEKMLLLAHTLRGLAGNIGADQVAALARSLESQLKDAALNEPEQLDIVLAELASALDKLLLLAATAKTKAPASSEALPRDNERLRASLIEMQRLLANSDASAVQQIATIEQELNAQTDPLQVRKLVRDVENYEFDSAIETLLKIAGELSIDLNTDQIRSQP